MADICAWLADLGLSRYASRFVEEEVDLDTLPHLREEDLEALGLPRALAARSWAPSRATPAWLRKSLSVSRAEQEPQPAASPGDLARRALVSAAGVDGERKLISVLFADLRGSTALIQELDAEAAVDRLRPAVDAMIDAVQDFSGTVNRVQGDGIMALFGAPIAQEDHALRACLAGLRMRDAINAMRDGALAPRVGVHSGEAVLRTLHNDLTREYEADGPAVHLAARMEQLADAGTVRTTRDTWRLVDGHVEAHSLGRLPVKGLSDPVSQYELLAASSAASRWEGRMRHGLSRLVGRERELAVLQETATTAASGRGQVVVLMGEAGMGKSRLLHEFLASPAMGTWMVRVAAASPHGTTTPYLPLKQLLRAVIGVTPEDRPAMIVDRLDAHLEAMAAQLEPLRVPLQALLDLEPEDSEWSALHPTGRRRRIQEAMCELALRRARQGPLLIVMEDLHWIDEETQEVLDRLVDAAGGTSLLLVFTCRPEYRPWFGKSYLVPIQIGPIPERGVNELLQELLGADPSLHALKSEIEARGEGRPLYLEEIVRDLVDRGVLSGERGHRRLARTDVSIPIPGTVQAVIGARIDRLQPLHKRLLQIAAVIGRRVPLDLLTAVANETGQEVRDGLGALQAAEFLFQTQSFPVAEYLFKHALTESVAYESLLRRQRRKYHTAALRAIQSRHAARLDEQVELLARHALNAELWSEAIEHLRRAGSKAVVNSAYHEAVEHLEQALVALQHLPESPERSSLAIHIRLELRPALGARAEYARLLTHLEEARALAASIRDHPREALIAADMVHVLYHTGQVEAALAAGEDAVHVARVLGDRRILILASANHAHAHFYAGRLRRSLEIAGSFAEALRTEFRHERIGATSTSACIWLGNLCGTNAMLGNFERGIRLGEEASGIAQETGLPFDQVMADSWRAFAHAVRGDGEAAVALGQRNAELVSTNDLEFLSIWSTTTYAMGLALLGAPQQAIALIEDMKGLRPQLRGLVIMSIQLGTVEAIARYEAGDHRGAMVLCEHLLERVTDHGVRLFEPVALRVLGLCQAVDGNRARALEQIEAARSLALSQGARPEVAHAELALAHLNAELGDSTQASSWACSALEAYESMNLTRWVPEARALAAR